MKTCTRCGATHDDSAKFCTSCGAAFEAEAKTETANESINENVFGVETSDQAPAEKAGSRQINVGLLVWSIINIVACRTPLGIASLVFVIVAQSATTAENEASNLKIAKILNIIGTSAMAVFVVLYIIFFVIVLIAGGMSAMEHDITHTLFIR